MPLAQSSVPSLVEVLKTIGYAWRSLDDQAAAMPAPEAEDSPKAVLRDQQVRHPIYDLFLLIEEHTGISRGITQQVAWRINTPLGLQPFKRTRRPTDPELAGFLDDTKPDFPDLQPISRKLNKCDVNGTTATILRRFEEKHPGVLASFGFIGQRVEEEQTALPQQAGDQKKGEGVGKPQTNLRPCDERAYSQYLFAAQQEASLKSDKEVYDWLSECNSIDESDLPSFATWSKYVRNARKAKGQGKNSPRIGNPTKSVVRGDRVEYQKKKRYGEEDPDQ